MQTARQRALIAALGITPWIPRAATISVVHNASQALWRQRADSGGTSLPSPVNIQQDHLASHQPLLNQPSLNSGALSPEILDLQQHSPQAGSLPAPTQTSGFVPEQPAVRAEIPVPAVKTWLNFRLQAFETSQWIILIDEADLQESLARKLWQNILLAVGKPAISHFNWPLADGLRWQSAAGAKAALGGFLFKMGRNKRVGLMSSLVPEACPERVERLPHLQELMTEPAHKRALWQLLKAQ